MNHASRVAWAGVTVGVLVLPLAAGSGFYLNVLNFIALYSMVAIGLSLLVGYCGQLSISHSAFFAIGAYASAIATLSFTIIVEILIKEMTPLTGGLQGLSSIPPITLGGVALDSDFRFHFLVWPVTMLLFLFALNLVDSRLGRALRAIREGEVVARLFGVDARRYKVKVFVLSSVFASIAGSLYAHFVSFVSPAVASLMFAIDIIMVLALGGFTLLWGALPGVAALTVLNEYLTPVADYKRAIYGLALI